MSEEVHADVQYEWFMHKLISKTNVVSPTRSKCGQKRETMNATYSSSDESHSFLFRSASSFASSAAFLSNARRSCI